MSLNLDDLRRLPIDEKMKIVEVLWDDICESNEPPQLSEDQMREIKRRAAELDADPSLAITREELWRRVDELRG